MTTGSRLYPQKVSAAFVKSGQYACPLLIMCLVKYDLPMLSVGSWFQWRGRPSAFVAVRSRICCWNGFQTVSLYVSSTCFFAVSNVVSFLYSVSIRYAPLTVPGIVSIRSLIVAPHLMLSMASVRSLCLLLIE